MSAGIAVGLTGDGMLVMVMVMDLGTHLIIQCTHGVVGVRPGVVMPGGMIPTIGMAMEVAVIMAALLKLREELGRPDLQECDPVLHFREERV